MKWSEIPRYRRRPNYMVHVDWADTEDRIRHYENNHNLKIEPDFQRLHVWTLEQKIKFVEFGLRGGESGMDIYFNHPGWQKDYKGEFVLVDGKQRLDAVIRFFNNEFPIFNNIYIKDMEGRPCHTQTPMFRFHVHNLPTKKDVLLWYIEMNEGGVVHTQEELDKARELLEKIDDH